MARVIFQFARVLLIVWGAQEASCVAHNFGVNMENSLV